jgi:hypothetical protein
VRVAGGISENKRVVEESAGVEEDGFRFEEEFGEEGEVLGVELIITRSERDRILSGSLGCGYTLCSSPSS